MSEEKLTHDHPDSIGASGRAAEALAGGLTGKTAKWANLTGVGICFVLVGLLIPHMIWSQSNERSEHRLAMTAAWSAVKANADALRDLQIAVARIEATLRIPIPQRSSLPEPPPPKLATIPEKPPTDGGGE